MAMRLAVAISSVWPPDRKKMPGTAAGTWRDRAGVTRITYGLLEDDITEQGEVGHLLGRGLVLGARAAGHHARLEHGALQVDGVRGQRAVHRRQHRLGHRQGARGGVVALAADVWLDDGHQPGDQSLGSSSMYCRRATHPFRWQMLA